VTQSSGEPSHTWKTTLVERLLSWQEENLAGRADATDRISMKTDFKLMKQKALTKVKTDPAFLTSGDSVNVRQHS
jgi:hypothetical protein